MDLLSAVGLGAVGGMLVEAVNLYGRITGWRNARHAARGRKGAQLPALDRYIDVPADSLVAVTRLLMGAAAGLLFHSEVTGAPAAVAVGACAPALLRQLGASRSIGDIVLGQDGPDRAPDERSIEAAAVSTGAPEGSLPATATPSVEPAQ